MIDAAIRRQAPDENGGEIKGSTPFLKKDGYSVSSS